MSHGLGTLALSGSFLLFNPAIICFDFYQEKGGLKLEQWFLLIEVLFVLMNLTR